MKKSLIPLALGGLSIGTTEFVMMGILPDVAKSFEISIPEAGHFISSYALGVVIGAPTLVALSGNIPPKRTLMALMGIFVIFNLLTAFSASSSMLIISRLFSGLPHGAFFGVGSVVASKLATKGKEAQAISMMFAGLTIANVAAVPIGTYIGHHISWRYTFGLIGAIGLITMLFLYLWMPEVKLEEKRNLRKELAFFKRKEAWLIVLITAIGTGGLFAWISYIAPLMTEVAKLSEDKVPYVMILAGVGMVVGNIIGGKLADKFSAAKTCLGVLLAIPLCLLINHFAAPNIIFALIMVFVTGVVTFTLGTPIQVLMIKTAKEAAMLGASITQAAFNMGNALGAFLGGLPIIAGYGYTSPLFVGIAMALFGALCTYLLIQVQKKKGYTEPEGEKVVVLH